MNTSSRTTMSERSGHVGNVIRRASLAMVSFFVSLFALFVGHASPKLHIAKTCRFAGHPIDDEYRSTVDSGRFFPVSYPCTEDFNLVPWWVNPLVVLAALVCIVSAALFMRTLVRIIGTKIRAEEEGGNSAQ